MNEQMIKPKQGEPFLAFEQRFLESVKLKYAPGYRPTRKEKNIEILLEIFSSLYLRAWIAGRKEAMRGVDEDGLDDSLETKLRIQYDIKAADLGISSVYLDLIFVRAFGAVRVGDD